jgi:hypothetical protein
MTLSSGISQKTQPDCRALIPSRNYTEIHIVTRTLVGVAFEAKRLKIGQIVLASVLARDDMIHFNGSLICRNAA